MIRKTLVLVLVSILLAGCIADNAVKTSTIQLNSTNKTPEAGTIQLTSSPSGAAVYLDNESQGTTPLVIMNIKPGNHTLEYRMNGFNNLTETITVPPGSSQFNRNRTLTAIPGSQQMINTPTTTKTNPVQVTITISKAQMLVGESNVFSGTATGTSGIYLTLFGPGKYSDGIVLSQISPDTMNNWNHLWSPGDKIQSGKYTIIASDFQKTVSDQEEFKVIGNGVVSVTLMNSYTIDEGAIISFSGRCTTGAPSVMLTLSGPEQFAQGVVLGTVQVTPEETWSYRYPTDYTIPAGTYTISVSDVPKTTTGTSKFVIG